MTVPDEAVVVELEPDKSQPRYVVFCSRFSGNPVGIPGHCFVVWTESLPVKDLNEVESYGFFPTKYTDQFISFFKGVPSTLVSEPVSPNPEALSFNVVAFVSPDLFTRSKSRLKKWKETDFKLGSTDCIGFAEDIASTIGLKTPGRTFDYPQDYINKLRELNQSDLRLDNEEVFLSNQAQF